MSKFKHLEHKQSFNSNKITNSNVRNNTISTTPPQYSVFDKSFQQGTTFNAGKLIPILLQEVYPGDIYEVSANLLIRMSALTSTPFMNVNLDINYFFIPYSIIDPNWEEVIGSVSNLSSNSQSVSIQNLLDIPRLDLKFLNTYSNSTLLISFYYTENDLANYFNIPIKKKYVDNSAAYQSSDLGPLYSDPNTSWGFNLYPFLAYGKVWNDWYRNENYTGEVDITSVLSPDIERNGGKYITEKLKNDTHFSNFNWNTVNSSASYDAISNNDYQLKKMNCLGFGLLPTANFRDYFTSSLPYQQKVVEYNLNIGNVSGLNTNDLVFDPNKGYRMLQIYSINGNYGNNIVGDVNNRKANPGTVSNAPQNKIIKTSGNVNSKTYFEIGDGPTPTGANYNAVATNIPNKVEFDQIPSLEIDINEFRNSLVLQHLFETFAICGSRYVEQLSSIWGVEIDPKEIKRSEFLGGKNFNLIFNNTQQTSSNVNVGNQNYQLLGSSITSSLYNSVTHEKIKLHASQHGLLLGVLTARTNINYGSQGLPKIFLYKNFLDFYNPKFNGISDQPIESLELSWSYSTSNHSFGTLNQYLLRQKTNGVSGTIYGFNEPFLNLKNNINNANGFLSICSDTSLFSQFLFGKDYTPSNPSQSNPNIFDNSQNYLYDPNIIQNTIFQVNDGNNQFYHQFISLITFDIKYMSKQPLYSHPGVKYI